MESEHESESNDHLRSEEASGSAEISKSSHSSSSSGSSSDYFQIDAKLPQKSSTYPAVSPEAQGNSQSQGGENFPSDSSSQVSHATNESTLQTALLVESPLNQMMEKTGGYDPNRIPDSVFGRSSNAAMDWSLASNESLFSLHLGNSSFSREQFLMMSEELYKSGELNRHNEIVKPGRPPLFPIGKLQEEKAANSDKKPEQTEATEEMMEDSPKLDVSDQVEEKETEVELNGNSSLISRPSDASGTSTQSFAFPILVDPKTNSIKAPSPRQQETTSPRQQEMKRAVYEEILNIEKQTKSSSSYWGFCCCCCCCSLPHWSCPSYQLCWSCNWCKKCLCCSCF